MEPVHFEVVAVIVLALFAALSLSLLAYVAVIGTREFTAWVRSGRWWKDLWP